jgi:hypothetical protein
VDDVAHALHRFVGQVSDFEGVEPHPDATGAAPTARGATTFDDASQSDDSDDAPRGDRASRGDSTAMRNAVKMDVEVLMRILAGDAVTVEVPVTGSRARRGGDSDGDDDDDDDDVMMSSGSDGDEDEEAVNSLGLRAYMVRCA